MRRVPNPPEVKREMTPMIDVTFLLLIFFLVTLNFRTLEGRLDSNMPKERGAGDLTLPETPRIEVVLRVLRPGTRVPDAATASRARPEGRFSRYKGRLLGYSVGAREFRDLDELSAFLGGFDRQEPVSLDVREGAVYQDVVGLIDTVIAAGFEQIAFTAAPSGS